MNQFFISIQQVVVEVFIDIALNLYINLEEIDILPILSIHRHSISLPVI